MINIDIVQNKEFSIGYPYNSPIDSYFKSLTPEYISNYNIDDDTLEEINKHKRATQKFDKDLFTLMNDVSIFIQDYGMIADTITSKYDEKTIVYEEYNTSKILLEKQKTLIESEMAFMVENKTKLETDLSQTVELLTHYETQLITYTIVDPASYIANLNSDIVLIDTTLATITNSIAFYMGSIEADIVSHVEDIELISMYDFDDVLLKKSYETWIIRPEQFYKSLVSYYKANYEAKWTAGGSIMYDKNVDYVSASKHIMTSNSDKLASEYIREYKFKIEKELKTESINLIDTEAELSPSELQDSITKRHIHLLNVAIEEVSTLLGQKQFAIDSIISPDAFKDYQMYKELIQLKRRHISSNIANIISGENDGVSQYDSQIAELKNSYKMTEITLGEKTYLKYFYDHERTKKTLDELTHTLNILQLTSTGVIDQEADVDVIETKIEIYETAKNKLEAKIQEINRLSSLKLIEKSEINDNITLISSNMFATENIIKNYIALYETQFSSRLKMFYELPDLSQHQIINHIVNNNVHYSMSLGYQELKNYTSDLKWWDELEKKKLFSMYEQILSIVEGSMQQQWTKEFNHPAICNIKSEFYNDYIQELIIGLYAEIVQYINYKKYNETIEKALMLKVSRIKTVLEDYIPMAIISKKNIQIPTTFYDYSKLITFDVSELGSDEIKESIMGYIMNNYNYMVGINLAYKLEKTQAREQLKIDLMWKNMEIKNG